MARLLLIFLLIINFEKLFEGVKKYENEINDASIRYSISKELIIAVIQVESGWNPNAVNKDCNGLMQVKKGSFNPRLNIMAGASILRRNLNLFHNDYDRSITAYRYGIGKTQRLNLRATSYSKKVLTIAVFIKLKHIGVNNDTTYKRQGTGTTRQAR